MFCRLWNQSSLISMRYLPVLLIREEILLEVLAVSLTKQMSNSKDGQGRAIAIVGRVHSIGDIAQTTY